MVQRNGQVDRWCGTTFPEVKQALDEYRDEAASIEAHTLAYDRGGRSGRGSGWCDKATRMPRAEAP